MYERASSIAANTSTALDIPGWVSAIAASVGVLVAVLAIWLTLKQIRQTAQQLSAASKQQAQDSEDRTRPYVNVDVVPGLQGPGTYDLLIQNVGVSIAKDIVLALEGVEFVSLSPGDSIGPALRRTFDEPFDLAPGARRRVMWRHEPNPQADPPGELGAPSTGSIRVQYRRETTAEESRYYVEKMRYDVSALAALIPVPYVGSEARGSAKPVNDQLRDIEHALRAVAQNLGELNR